MTQININTKDLRTVSTIKMNITDDTQYEVRSRIENIVRALSEDLAVAVVNEYNGYKYFIEKKRYTTGCKAVFLYNEFGQELRMFLGGEKRYPNAKEVAEDFFWTISPATSKEGLTSEENEAVEAFGREIYEHYEEVWENGYTAEVCGRTVRVFASELCEGLGFEIEGAEVISNRFRLEHLNWFKEEMFKALAAEKAVKEEEVRSDYASVEDFEENKEAIVANIAKAVKEGKGSIDFLINRVKYFVLSNGTGTYRVQDSFNAAISSRNMNDPEEIYATIVKWAKEQYGIERMTNAEVNAIIEDIWKAIDKENVCLLEEGDKIEGNGWTVECRIVERDNFFGYHRTGYYLVINGKDIKLPEFEYLGTDKVYIKEQYDFNRYYEEVAEAIKENKNVTKEDKEMKEDKNVIYKDIEDFKENVNVNVLEETGDVFIARYKFNISRNNRSKVFEVRLSSTPSLKWPAKNGSEIVEQIEEIFDCYCKRDASTEDKEVAEVIENIWNGIEAAERAKKEVNGIKGEVNGIEWTIVDAPLNTGRMAHFVTLNGGKALRFQEYIYDEKADIVYITEECSLIVTYLKEMILKELDEMYDVYIEKKYREFAEAVEQANEYGTEQTVRLDLEHTVDLRVKPQAVEVEVDFEYIGTEYTSKATKELFEHILSRVGYLFEDLEEDEEVIADIVKTANDWTTSIFFNVDENGIAKVQYKGEEYSIKTDWLDLAKIERRAEVQYLEAENIEEENGETFVELKWDRVQR